MLVPPMKGRHAVVILSGGMDSSTLLYYVRHTLLRKVSAVSFFYGQRHARELDSAQAIAFRCGQIINAPRGPISDIAWTKVDISSVMRVFPSALTGTLAVPEGHYAEESMKQTVVPNRNAIMLSIAAGIAISVGAQEVYFGPHAGDHAIYPDCRSDFVRAFSRAIWLANRWTPVRIRAPFLSLTKGQIVKLGLDLHGPYELTWTCYQGGNVACGRCGTCVERLEAFAEAGAQDLLPYADMTYWRDVTDAKKTATA